MSRLDTITQSGSEEQPANTRTMIKGIRTTGQ
jgi:hypothetical protein